VMLDIRIPRNERVTPQSRFGYPIEDGEPLLPRAEFHANMIVSPLPKSQEQLP
jgi:acetolactate synthase-1/2/3 large subunit